jgi:hypothetical protein
VGDVLSGLCQEILRILVVFAASGELLAILGRTTGSCPHCGGRSIRRVAGPGAKALRTVGQLVYLVAYGWEALLMALLVLFFVAEGPDAISSWGLFLTQQALIVAGLVVGALLTRPYRRARPVCGSCRRAVAPA